MAILLVLLRHSWPTVFAGAGIVGVVMFFTVSGYLITGLLRREFGRTGRVSLKNFAVMRALRLVPALALMLLVFTVVELVFNPLGDRPIVFQTLIAALLYLRDLPLPFATSPAINTLWTLAVEEQFYLIWPILLIAALRRHAVGALLVTLILTLLVTSSISVAVFSADPATVYIFPTTWASSLLIGAAAALYRDRLTRLMDSLRLFGPQALVLCALVCAAVSLYPDAKNVAWIYVAGGPLVSTITLALIMNLERWDTLPFRALEPLRLLGLVSYGVYLWNALVLNWLSFAGPWAGPLTVVGTLAMGIASWHTVERLGRRVRSRYGRRRTLDQPDASSTPQSIDTFQPMVSFKRML